MHAEFNVKFAIGRQFVDREELNKAFLEFGKKYNVVFSIFNSHIDLGRFHYICKHSKTKRANGKKSTTATDSIDNKKDNDEEELVDLTEKQLADENENNKDKSR